MQRRSIAGVPTAIGTPQSICFKHDCSYNEPVSKRSRSQITPSYFVIIYYYTPKSRWQCSRSTFLYGSELGYDLRDSFCREDISSIFFMSSQERPGTGFAVICVRLPVSEERRCSGGSWPEWMIGWHESDGTAETKAQIMLQLLTHITNIKQRSVCSRGSRRDLLATGRRPASRELDRFCCLPAWLDSPTRDRRVNA